MHSVRRFWVGVLLLTPLVSGQAAEPATDWRVPTLALLDTAWDITLASRKRANELYAEATRLAPGNSLPLAAYWVVLLKQGRNQDAGKHLEEYLRAEPANLTALRMRTRLYMMEHNHSAALVSANRIADRVRAIAANSADKLSADEEDSLTFLGRLIGFLEGPLAKTYDQRERAELQTRVQAGLNDRRKALIEQGRREVLDSYNQKKDVADSADNAAKVAAEEAKDRKATELDKQDATIDQKMRELEAKQQAIKAAALDRLNDLGQQEQRALNEHQKVNARAQTLSRDSTLAQSQAKQLNDNAQREQNPQLRQRLQQAANDARAEAQRIQGELERMSIGVQRLERDITDVRKQKQAVETKATKDAGKIEDELKEWKGKKERTEKTEKRLNRPSEASSSQAESLLAQSRSFTTYEPLRLEELRERLQKAIARP